LRDDTLGLLDQRQQDMLGIDLVMTIALDDLSRALGGFLGALSKTIKSHHMNVTVRDINRVGSVLDSAVEAGANTINGIQFDVLDRTAATSEARRAAVANARAVAEEVAAAAGVQLGEVQTINVHGGGYSVPVYGRAAQDAAESIPVSPGEMTISVEVSIVYAIR
jgi:uncharacterized protein